MKAEKVDYIFRGTSPRAERPSFGDGWVGNCPAPARGWAHITNGDRFAILVECYKYSTVSGARRVFAANQGFAAVGSRGDVIRWADRFGRKYEANFVGIRAVETANV
jgi:hypothetical protein